MLIQATDGRYFNASNYEAYPTIEMSWIDFLFGDQRWIPIKASLTRKFYILTDLIRKYRPFVDPTA